MNLKKKDIIIYIILFFLIFKTCFVSEKMANVSKTDIKNAVKEVYDADVEAIRNLSSLANNLTKDGKLVIKGGLEIDGPLNVSNDIKCDGDGYFGPAFIGSSVKDDVTNSGKTKYAQFSHVNCKDDVKYGFRQAHGSTIYLNSSADITLWKDGNDFFGYTNGFPLNRTKWHWIPKQ